VIGAMEYFMAKYRLRFFFDPGGGICLWAGNDAARERFDYAIDASQLPLPENTWRRILYLCYWYDTCIDWNYPPDPSPWDEAEWQRFNVEAQKLLALVREQLSSEFEIVDESMTGNQT
jgi:hypothetical protein